MTGPRPDFYVTGGTFGKDAMSYVQRRADTELYEALRRGDFCYMLTSRQMGKSSLMVRAATRLRADGVAVAVLDLSAIGSNLTAEQWYNGLLAQLGEELDLEDELEDFWFEHPRLGLLQRWMQALRDVVLARLEQPVVIFVDEIDAVRSLRQFSTDEFFAAIREGYNRRSTDPVFNRLAFCLLGVATPSDLIQDPRTTPFNIGRRIDLEDFTAAEADALAMGLGRDEGRARALLRRIFYWTGGHPYLTQHLCQAVARDASVQESAGVDRICEELFFSTRARERDDNLLFVRKRLLAEEYDRAALLDLYRQIREHKKRICDADTNPLISALRLAGIVRVLEGCLQVRNHIYSQVFDRNWIIANMPDAEIRRQRAAFWKGVLRTTAAAAVVVIIIAILAVHAYRQSNRADEQARLAEFRAKEAESQTERLRQIRAASLKGEVRTYLDRHQPIHALALLAYGLEKDPTNTVVARDLADLLGQRNWLPHGDSVIYATFSPDGRRILTASWDGSARIWDVRTGEPLGKPLTHEGRVQFAAFSTDGSRVVTASWDHTARLWNAVNGEPIGEPLLHPEPVNWAEFSPDGHLLVTAYGDWTTRKGGAKIWDTETGNVLGEPLEHSGRVSMAIFSPDGQQIATAGWDGSVKL